MDDKVKVNPTEARQGRKGSQVLVILVAALLLALVAWWVAGLYGQSIEPEDPVGGAPTEQPIESPTGTQAPAAPE